jgi:hypothetical protein
MAIARKSARFRRGRDGHDHATHCSRPDTVRTPSIETAPGSRPACRGGLLVRGADGHAEESTKIALLRTPRRSAAPAIFAQWRFGLRPSTERRSSSIVRTRGSSPIVSPVSSPRVSAAFFCAWTEFR